MKVRGKKDISGIPWFGRIGQVDRRTRVRRLTRDSRLSALAGWHTRGHISFQRSRSSPWNANHSLSSTAKKSRFPLGSLSGTRKREMDREGESREGAHKRNGRWADGRMDWQRYRFRASKILTEGIYSSKPPSASTLLDCAQASQMECLCYSCLKWAELKAIVRKGCSMQAKEKCDYIWIWTMIGGHGGRARERMDSSHLHSPPSIRNIL